MSTPIFCQTSLAQDIPSSSVLETLKNCQSIQNDKSRLTCFDDAVSTLTGAVESKELLIIDKAVVEKSEEENFGKPANSQSPLKKLLGLDKTEAEQATSEVVISKIVKTEKTARKKIRFFLENGQVWEQSQPNDVYISKKKEYTAYIKKATISGYKLRLNDKGALIRVKRIK